MGGISSTPRYDVMANLPSTACPIAQGFGLGFVQVHSFGSSSSFTQNLSIRPRIMPRGQSDEEMMPGSYTCKLSSEIEGVQVGATFNANSAVFNSSIPYNDDFDFSLSFSPFPIFNLVIGGSCQTDVINAQLEFKNTDFEDVVARESVTVQVSNSLIVGEQFAYDFSSNSYDYGLTASMQLGNFLFALTRDKEGSVFGAKLYANQNASVGFMRIKNRVAGQSIYGLGYSIATDSAVVEGSILSNLNVSGKMTKQLAPNLGMSASLSYDILNGMTLLGVDLQLATGSSLA